MAIAKIILNGVVQMDVTQDTVAANNLLSGETATGADGEQVIGAYVPSGGGDSGLLDGVIARTLSSISNSTATTIGQYAFAYCQDLSTATFDRATSVEPYAFVGCSTLQTFNGLAVEVVHSNAFASCSAISDVSLPAVISLYENCFASLTGLSFLSLPEALSISGVAFQKNTGIKELYTPKLTFVGGSAFSGCTNLRVFEASKLTTCGQGAFSSCTALSFVSMDSLMNPSSYAFNSCASLTSVYIPLLSDTKWGTFKGTGLLEIGFQHLSIVESAAFALCRSLSTASLPGLKTIGSSGFQSCYNLLSLYLMSTAVVKLSNVNAFASTPISNYTTSTGGVYGSIFVPSSLYATYIASTNWINYADRFVSV